MRYQLEICCQTASDALAAAQNGADRVELNSALELGGLTPSAGSLRVAREVINVPVMAMIRPRAGDFRYDDREWRTALEDAGEMIRLGADGLVFGFLKPDSVIDRDRVREMVSLSEGRECVFHRAFDYVPDWRSALDTLISLGVRRVLTGGGKTNAADGAERIAEMVRFAQNAIEILPGGGVRPDNVRRILHATGCRQVHLSAKGRPGAGQSLSGVRLGDSDDGQTHAFTDGRIVSEMRAILDSEEAMG